MRSDVGGGVRDRGISRTARREQVVRGSGERSTSSAAPSAAPPRSRCTSAPSPRSPWRTSAGPRWCSARAEDRGSSNKSEIGIIFRIILLVAK